MFPSYPHTIRGAADRLRSGFSLIEVILSIGILAIAVVSLLGLLGPSLGAVQTVMDTNAGVSAVSEMNTILNTTPFYNGSTTDSQKASVYTWIRNSTNGNLTAFFFYNELDTTTGISTPLIAVADGVQLPGVTLSSSSSSSSTSTPTIVPFSTLVSDAASSTGTRAIDGPVIVMTLSISPMAQSSAKGGAFPNSVSGSSAEDFYQAPSTGIFPQASTNLNENPNAVISGGGIAYPEAYLPILVQVFSMSVDQLVNMSTTGVNTSVTIANYLTESNRLFTYTTAKLR